MRFLSFLLFLAAFIAYLFGFELLPIAGAVEQFGSVWTDILFVMRLVAGIMFVLFVVVCVRIRAWRSLSLGIGCAIGALCIVAQNHVSQVQFVWCLRVFVLYITAVGGIIYAKARGPFKS